MSETIDRQLRAGDRDRAAVVELLRRHHLDGRLSVEEFEERVERAQRAVTLLELGDLHEDLPELAPDVQAAAVGARLRGGPRRPGHVAFVERVRLAAPPDEVREQAFGTIAPALARHDYALSITGRTLRFTRRRRPGWTIVVAILAFPIGLLALTQVETDEIVVEIAPGAGGGTTLVASGTGSLAVRRAFAQLRD